jgi:hypothetical protein
VNKLEQENLAGQGGKPTSSLAKLDMAAFRKEKAIYRTEGDISPYKQRIPYRPFHPQTDQSI